MAWQDAGLGAWVYDGAVNRIDQDGATTKRVYDLTITSTSTLVVRGEGASGTVGRDGTLSVLSSPPAGGRALRTFAIPAWDNVAVYWYEDSTGVHAQQYADYAGHGPSGRFIVYFETRAPAGRIPRRQLVYPGPDPMVETAVPSSEPASALDVVVSAHSFDGGQTGGGGSTLRELGFEVPLYLDPHVVQIPRTWPVQVAGRWMMVLARRRGPNPSRPDNSLSDVVCFLADEPTFTAGVEGPFVLVDDTDVIPAQQARVWCGVPSIVMEEDQALIFLTAEPSGAGALVGDSTAAGASVPSGVVSLTLSPVDFTRAVVLGSGPPARPLGPVQLWVVEEGTSYAPVRFEERFSGAGDVKTADPVALSRDGKLVLFTAVIPDPAGVISESGAAGRTKGHGIWRAASLPGGTRGVDFAVRCTPGVTEFSGVDAPDLVRATNTDDGISADPDPFEVQPGEWRVFCGGSDDGLPRAVLASSGTDADVFADVGPERLDTPNRLWGVHAETHLDEDTLHVHRWTVNLAPALVRPPTNLRP